MKKSPGAIFRERSEPEGRVSGMIRANPVKICVRRSRTQSRRSRVIAFTPLEFLLSIYSPNLQSVQGRTPACGNRSFPLRCGGCGGHPPHIRAYTRNRFFAYQPQVTRRREPPPMPFAHNRGVFSFAALAAINSAAPAAIILPARMTECCVLFRLRQL